MGIRQTIAGWISGAGQAQAKVPVVDAKAVGPTMRQVPSKWSTAFFGPGQPISPGLMESDARRQDQETEPRSFVYVPNVNSTMSPRMAYGLLPFSELRALAEGVPEIGQSLRILIEELKSFRPTIARPDDTEITPADPEWVNLKWMVESPDRANPWPVWLSRFLYNVLVYDAGAVYRERLQGIGRGNQVIGLRVIDGSTLFALVDEQGEQPKPPAPAFEQIIYGMPKGLFNAHQIWYRPRHLRADAPYGRSPIEDSLPAVRLLANLWQYEGSWYTEGTTSEQVFTAPEDYTTEQILAFEDTFNARMAGNAQERAGRIRFVPSGTTSLALKDARFRDDVYMAASNVVRMAYGIPRTEAGESPGSGLGGSGFLEAMQSMFYRMGLAPLKTYVESLFNETLQENRYYGFQFKLSFPRDSIDPKKEEEKTIAQFQAGIINRNEARRAIGMDELPGPEGQAFGTGEGSPEDPQAGQQDPQDPRFANLDAGLDGKATIPVRDKIPVRRGIEVAPPIRVRGANGRQVGKLPVRGASMLPVSEPIKVKKGVGVSSEEDAHFGSPIVLHSGIAYLGKQGLPAAWMPGQDACDEAVYLIDRAMAPDEESYLVPVTYHATAGGMDGIVTWPASGKRGKRVSSYDPKFIEAAAALDYIAGVVRQAEDYISHPEQPGRPVLLASGVSFADQPSSPFVASQAGKEVSPELKQSLQAIAADEALWKDVAACAGAEAAQKARDRVTTLLEMNRIPDRANATPEE